MRFQTLHPLWPRKLSNVWPTVSVLLTCYWSFWFLKFKRLFAGEQVQNSFLSMDKFCSLLAISVCNLILHRDFWVKTVVKSLPLKMYGASELTYEKLGKRLVKDIPYRFDKTTSLLNWGADGNLQSTRMAITEQTFGILENINEDISRLVTIC